MEKVIYLKWILGKVFNLGYNCNMEFKIECLVRLVKILGKYVLFFFGVIVDCGILCIFYWLLIFC